MTNVAFHKIVVLSLESLVLKVKWNYQHYVLKGVACAVLQVLLVNFAVIGPCQHQCLASKQTFWLVTYKLSLATRLVSRKVSVEP